MTPNEICTLIASNFDRELDIPFKLQLMERVKVWRSRLVANSLEKHPNQRKFFRQTLFMDMKLTSDIPCSSLVGCKVMATIDDVPLLVRVGSQLFDYVGSPDGKSPFKEADPGTGAYLSEGRFSHLFPIYEFTNHKIVIPKADQLLIRVDGIFDDPFTADAISCKCQNVPCDTWNTEYPLSGDILQLIIQSILVVDYNRPLKTDSKEIPVTN